MIIDRNGAAQNCCGISTISKDGIVVDGKSNLTKTMDSPAERQASYVPAIATRPSLFIV